MLSYLIGGVLMVIVAIVYFLAGSREKRQSGAYGGNIAVGLLMLLVAAIYISNYRIETSVTIPVVSVVQCGDLYEITLDDASVVSTHDALNTTSDEWSLTKQTATDLLGLTSTDAYILNIPAVPVTVYESGSTEEVVDE